MELRDESWDAIFPTRVQASTLGYTPFLVTRSQFGLRTASSLGLSNGLAPNCHLERNSLRLVVLLRSRLDPFGARPFLRSSRTGMISGIRCVSPISYTRRSTGRKTGLGRTRSRKPPEKVLALGWLGHPGGVRFGEQTGITYCKPAFRKRHARECSSAGHPLHGTAILT